MIIIYYLSRFPTKEYLPGCGSDECFLFFDYYLSRPGLSNCLMFFIPCSIPVRPLADSILVFKVWIEGLSPGLSIRLMFWPLPHRGVSFRLHWMYFLFFDYYFLLIRFSYEGISPGLWIRSMFFIFWLLFFINQVFLRRNISRVVELFNVLYSLFYIRY